MESAVVTSPIGARSAFSLHPYRALGDARFRPTFWELERSTINRRNSLTRLDL